VRLAERAQMFVDVLARAAHQVGEKQPSIIDGILLTLQYTISLSLAALINLADLTLSKIMRPSTEDCGMQARC